MLFVLSSKTETENAANKVQLHFRYLDPNAPAPDQGQPTMPMNPNYVNFNGTFDKELTDAFKVGALYEMTLNEVVLESAED